VLVMGARRTVRSAGAIAAATFVALSFGGGASAAPGPVDAPGTGLLPGGAYPIVLSPGPPLGSKTPSGIDALAETASAGVNVFRVGPGGLWTSEAIASALAWDRAAAARHVYTWVNLSGYSQALPGSADDRGLTRVVTTLTGDPSGSAVALWRGRDEPWWSDIAPPALQFAYCRVTSRGDASWCAGEAGLHPRPLWVTIEAPLGTAADLAPYGAVTDVHGVDIYPITLGNPAPDLHRVGTWTSTLASIAPAPPVWTTLQICAHASWSPATGAFVLPSREQERYMAYDAIANGAQALAFYGGDNPRCWNASDAKYGWNWTFWQSVLEPLVHELSPSAPIAPAVRNVHTNTFVATSDPTTEAVVRQGTSVDDVWLIALRSGPGSATVTFSGLPAWARSGSAYTENRAVTASGGSFRDSLGQWTVHVYHFVEPLGLESEVPSSARAGDRVSLYGHGLAAATAVSFAGIAARFTVRSDGELLATVPRRARSGRIAVTSPLQRVVSKSSFSILPSLKSRPRVTGAPRVGRVLRATTGHWYGDPLTGYRFAWMRCNAQGRACRSVPGATHRSLRLSPGWAGGRIRVRVAVRTRSGSASATSAPTPLLTR
jgi:hypothetical protein